MAQGYACLCPPASHRGHLDTVEGGWFVSESEVARLALAEFVRHHKFDLQEQFQRDDIRWAAGLKSAKG